MLLDDVSDSSLSGLRVDSDDGFVSEGAICGVEGKVGDLETEIGLVSSCANQRERNKYSLRKVHRRASDGRRNPS